MEKDGVRSDLLEVSSELATKIEQLLHRLCTWPRNGWIWEWRQLSLPKHWQLRVGDDERLKRVARHLLQWYPVQEDTETVVLPYGCGLGHVQRITSIEFRRNSGCDLEVLCEVLRPAEAPSPQFLAAPSLLRIIAGSKEDRSCGGDVEDEAVVEFDASPGTTAEGLFTIESQTWLTTTGPLTSVTVLFAKFANGQYGRSLLEQLHSDKDIRSCTYTSTSSFVWATPLTVTIGMENLDLLSVSNSLEPKTLLRTMCMEAPESIKKCLTSGFVDEVAGFA